jgi:thiamine biosynthesis lipoprotein
MVTATNGYVQTRVYMDTMVTIQAPDTRIPVLRDRVERAFGWFREVEQRCSRFDPGSELRQLCARAGRPVSVSPLLFRAIEFALAVAAASEGAFDPTIGDAMAAHGFNRNYLTGAIVPAGDASAGVNFRDVHVERHSRTVTISRPLQLDLGAVAKGLAIDLAAETMSGCPGFLINAGGDIRVHGHGPEGGAWRIGVKDPRQPPRLLTSVSMTEGAVCTSGGYERPARDGGHHILSPQTGASPAGVASVTVMAPTAMVADALSTAAFVLGVDAGLSFLRAQGVDGLLVDHTGRLWATDGMKGNQ